MSPGSVCEWIVLRRARNRSVTWLGGCYFTDGQPVPEHLTGAFDQALAAGHLDLVEEGDAQRLAITLQGRARFDELTTDAPRMPGPDSADD